MATIQKINFKTVMINCKAVHNLLRLQANRERLRPLFPGIDTRFTLNDFTFRFVCCIWVLGMKVRHVINKLNSNILYDESFIAYTSQGTIGGICGLYDINPQEHKAELWGIAFKGNTETHEVLRCLEDYCADNLNLQSIYACVDDNNKACKYFWTKHGYDNMYNSINMFSLKEVLIYEKILHKQNIG